MTSKSKLFFTALVTAAIGLPGIASAQPSTIPIQGTLTDSADMPYTGSQTVRFQIYDADTAGAVEHTESMTVNFADGVFTAYLGTIQVLDMDMFNGRNLWLGIKVGDDAEMEPRLAFGSVPYAAYAKETAAVPTGAVMNFDLAACPAGWSPLAGAAGRTIVGVAAGATVGGSVGTALTDEENRAHTHTVAVSGNTGSSSVAHTHSISHGHGATTSDSHNHRWVRFLNGFASYNSAGTETPAIGPIQVWLGGGSPAALWNFVSSSSADEYWYTNNDSHSHDVNSDTLTSGAASTNSHSHSFSDSASTTSGATASSVMPYIQLLVCRKD